MGRYSKKFSFVLDRVAISHRSIMSHAVVFHISCAIAFFSEFTGSFKYPERFLRSMQLKLETSFLLLRYEDVMVTGWSEQNGCGTEFAHQNLRLQTVLQSRRFRSASWTYEKSGRSESYSWRSESGTSPHKICVFSVKTTFLCWKSCYRTRPESRRSAVQRRRDTLYRAQGNLICYSITFP